MGQMVILLGLYHLEEIALALLDQKMSMNIRLKHQSLSKQETIPSELPSGSKGLPTIRS